MKTIDPLPRCRPVAGRMLDAQLHLLDRQVLDVDGVPVTTVDDLELSGPGPGHADPDGTPAPVLTALLTGPVLGTRIFGGRPPASRLNRIPWTDVADVGVVIRLGVPARASTRPGRSAGPRQHHRPDPRRPP